MKKLVLLTAGIVTAIPALAQQEQSPSVFSILLNATSKLVYYHPGKVLAVAGAATGYIMYKNYLKQNANDQILKNMTADELDGKRKDIEQKIKELNAVNTLKNFQQLIEFDRQLLEIKRQTLENRLSENLIPWHYIPGACLVYSLANDWNIVKQQQADASKHAKNVIDYQMWRKKNNGTKNK